MILANKIFEAIVLAAPGITKNVDERDAGTEWSQFIREWQAKTPQASNDS